LYVACAEQSGSWLRVRFLFLDNLRSAFRGNGILGKMGGCEGLLPVSLLLTGFLVIQGWTVKLGIAVDWLVLCSANRDLHRAGGAD